LRRVPRHGTGEVTDYQRASWIEDTR